MQHFTDATRHQIEQLEPLLVNYLLTPNEPTNDVIRHIFAAGGKRIRPALFLLTTDLIGYSGEHQMPIAAVCEYIHTASLLHDDVIDNSTLRRGKPTANSIWGDETAVLAGDLIYSAACRLMVKTRSLDLIDTFAECIRFMSESELFQLELLWKTNITKDQYDRVVLGKTAVLFEASTKTPGFLAQLPSQTCDALGDYGQNLGFVFQLADDLLDYTGQQETVGKAVAADLRNGKVTLPLICALENERTQQKTELKDRVDRSLTSGECSSEDMKAITSLINTFGGIDTTLSIGRKRVEQAQAALERTTQNFKQTEVSSRALDLLLALPKELLIRSH
jgi:octaprenyl-diphosphate synthase